MKIREKVFIVIIEILIVLIAVRIGSMAGNKSCVDSYFLIEEHGALVGPVYLL